MGKIVLNMKEERFKYKGVAVALLESDGKWFCTCEASKEIRERYPDLPKISRGWHNSKAEAEKYAKSEIDRIVEGK
ncbi:MAG: hypothetical protein WBB86_01445 [Candidatus Omnitrophota bacterium]